MFWRFWKTKVGGKKNWRKRENELNQGNLENFFAFQFCFEKIFDESIGRFWKTKVGGKKNLIFSFFILGKFEIGSKNIEC